MSYLELAKNFKGHKSGKHIAKVIIRNANRKGQLSNNKSIEVVEWNLTPQT